MGEVFIGTSGFMYPHWRGEFYPSDLPQKDWLKYYSSFFNTVEINATFYHQMKKETFAKWRKTVGPDFVFSIKGSRYITHIKRLKNCQEEVARFFEAAQGLNQESGIKNRGKKIHNSRFMIHYSNVVLWQLPPGMAFDKLRLRGFLEILPKNFWHAFEFRNEDWLCDGALSLLKKRDAAVVFQDYPDWPITEEVTTNFVYIRLHGKESLYSSSYGDRELKIWAKKIGSWANRELAVYVYFNNDALGYATENALELKKLLNA